MSFGPPRLIVAAMLAVHALAAWLLCSVQPGWLGWVGVPLVLVSAGGELRRLVAMPRSVRCLGDAAAGPSSWTLDDGWCGELLDAPCASRWLMVVRFVRPADRCVRWVVCGGDQMQDADARRLLRVLRRTGH